MSEFRLESSMAVNGVGSCVGEGTRGPLEVVVPPGVEKNDLPGNAERRRKRWCRHQNKSGLAARPSTQIVGKRVCRAET